MVDMKVEPPHVEDLGHNFRSADDDKENVKPGGFKEESMSGKTMTKSASQIVLEQSGRAMPAMRKGISRRVYPLVSLNPYEGNWTIKVRVTTKGPLRQFTNARGPGNVFNVELTDEEGTQIQATMFKEAADKFYDKLQLGKLYYISKGSLRAANKRYSTINNDYEMTLNEKSEVEEIPEEESSSFKVPLVTYNFVKLDELGPHVNGRALIDVIGVLQSVGSGTSIRRKSNNEEIPKRELVIADQSGKTVQLSLWNGLATDEGAKLLEMANKSPIVAAKAIRVGDYQGVSLSTTTRSMVTINPDIDEARALREWFDGAGKTAALAPAGASLPNGVNGARMTAERANLLEMTRPEVGEAKPAWFTLRACITFIKPDQPMWYLACTSCNKKVNQEHSNSYWCENCQKNYESCNRRYIMMAKVSDYSGEGWISAFNEQTETILGHSASSLAEVRTEDPQDKVYENVLKKAAWVPRVLVVSVAPTEYQGEKRQRITVRSVGGVDWAAECKLILEKISALR
ncbi:unnamed protein product [Calypogeia fissa]